jgi:hypothetical protein
MAKPTVTEWRSRLAPPLQSHAAAAALILSEVYGRSVESALDEVTCAVEAWARLYGDRGDYVRQARTLAVVRAGMTEGNGNG